jgi:intracellular sulfur oxidation DsrE/DsrF family protein
MFKIAGAAAAAGAGAAALGQAKPVGADQLRPDDPLYHFSAYEAIVNRDVTVRQLFAWPNIQNNDTFANIVNALNAWQFTYDVPADRIQIVVVAYASTTPVAFDDSIWQKYRIGDTLGMHNAQGNPFLHSRIPADQAQSPPADQNDPYYFDLTVEGLQRRGVLFLACNNSLRGSAAQAQRQGANPDGKSLADVVAEFQAHLVPGALLIPAGVTELVRLQDKGYRIVVNG